MRPPTCPRPAALTEMGDHSPASGVAVIPAPTRAQRNFWSGPHPLQLKFLAGSVTARKASGGQAIQKKTAVIRFSSRVVPQ